MTLNELLALCETDRMQLLIPLTSRLNTVLEFDTTDSAELDDVTRLYGEYTVKTLDVVSVRNAMRAELSRT